MHRKGGNDMNRTIRIGMAGRAAGILIAAAGGARMSSGALTVSDLRCEYLVEPRGIDEIAPRLSWVVASDERGQRQTAYRILVGSDPSALDGDRGDLWDSGRVAGDATSQIAYAGRPPVSRQACFWKVKTWDRDGVESAWSEPASWTMGLLAPSDWTARWISFPDDSPVHADREKLHLPPARHYRRAFEIRKPVRRATVYASALGIFDLHLNGELASDVLFSPGWSDYARRAYVRTFDVTGRIAGGANAIGAVLADGWYAGYLGYGLLVGYGPFKTGRSFYGKTPALLAQLEIEYADGTRETIGTDPSWQVSGDGPIREADFLMGEAFDARRDRPDWCSPAGAPDWRWEAAIPAEANGPAPAVYADSLGQREIDLGFRAPPRLQAYPAPPIRIIEELPARRITEPAPGVYVVDLGQNFAGLIRLKLSGPAGTTVRLRYAEMLHDDGRMMTENLRKARATDVYTLRGDPAGETWVPRFTYHGFQFVELTGLSGRPDLDAVTGLVIHNEMPRTGSFACSDPVLSKFWTNTWWTQRSNFIEAPTDCPQRDERFGWTGDAQIYAATAFYNGDVAAFFTKWLDDVAEAQRDSGAYPDYCPYPMAHGKPGATHGTAWTDAGVIVPWTVWRKAGDTRVIERHWSAMTRFMEWRLASDPGLGGVEIGNTWGDWLNVKEPTPIPFVDACYHAISARCMAEMAEAVGRDTEAKAYRARIAKLRAVFRDRHMKPDGSIAVPTQTAHVLALDAGLVPDDLVPAVADALVRRIAGNDHRMATGFLGTKPLLPVLSAHGHHDLAVRLFQSRRFPSWGYEVEQGANTVWERWDSYTKEFGFNGASGNQNASMNSFSHYAFGAVMEWAFQDLAGLAPLSPGFRTIRIRPGPPTPGSNPENSPISWARAEYKSYAGPIAVAWSIPSEGAFEAEVVIPANTTARIDLPSAAAATATEGGQPLAVALGVRVLGQQGDRTLLEVESGRYAFRSAWPPRPSAP